MPKATGTTGYYAVARGRIPGIYVSWSDCEDQVRGFAGAKYKKFRSAAEADEWKAQQDGGGVLASTSAVNAPTATSSKGKDPSTVEDPGKDVVYCDGACKGNGKPGSVAGVGVWWGHGDPRNIAERCPGGQTNNRAELIAIIRVLETAPRSGRPLLIKTDSQYSIKCFKEWMPKWRNNGFRKSDGSPVLNQAVIEYLDALLTERGHSRQRVEFEHVRGHVGIEGNEGADAQANLGCDLPEVDDPDWEAKEDEIMRRLQGSHAALLVDSTSQVASSSLVPPYVSNLVTHSAAVVPVEVPTTPAAAFADAHQQRADLKSEKSPPPPATNVASSRGSRFRPAATTAAPAVQSNTTPSRPQRLEQAIQEALRSPPPELHPAAPVTPTKPSAHVADATSSRSGAWTVTRPSRAGVTTLTSDGVFATAAARAAFTSPSRPVNDPRERHQEAGPSTADSPSPVRRRYRMKEPSYRSVGVEAKLCDCCREGVHRGSQSRKRSASPPPRRSQPPTARSRGKDRDGRPNTQESVKSLEGTQAISITESDLNAYAEGLLPDDQLVNDLSF